jgi:hypothetical protein
MGWVLVAAFASRLAEEAESYKIEGTKRECA